MMGEAAHSVDVTVTLLATSMDDAAVATCDATLIGLATDAVSLDDLAQLNDVITFDHELVNLDQLQDLQDRGFIVRPNASALRFAVDKAHQRTAFADAGIGVPRFLVVESSGDPALEPFLDDVGDVVVKAARGGYDGRGVIFRTSRAETLEAIDEWASSSTVVVEERLALLGEVAQIVVRSAAGDVVAYPLVSTVQSNGMCVEVRFPADDATLGSDAERIARRIAELTDAVGVVAVEFFHTARGLLVNEIALRPHNSGHWTIEGAVCSQFENHLRAIAGLPLGVTALRAPCVMVNFIGEVPANAELAAIPDLHIHHYGKTPKPQRKVGHATLLAADDAQLQARLIQLMALVARSER